MYAMSNLVVRGLRHKRGAVGRGGRRARRRVKNAAGAGRDAGVEGTSRADASRCSAVTAVRGATGSENKGVALGSIWSLSMKQLDSCTPRRAEQGHLPAAHANDRLPDRLRFCRALIGRAARSLRVLAPLKLSARDCCLLANNLQSIIAMAKSKDKQTSKSKAAKPAVTAAKTAFDPTLSSLFASSVRAELFRTLEIQDGRLTIFSVGPSASAAKAKI